MRRNIVAVVSALLCVLAAPAALAQQDAWRPVNHRAAVLYRAGQYAGSIATARRGLALCDSAGPTEVFCRSIFWENIAQDDEGLHRAIDAEAAYKKMLAIREQGLPPEHPLVADALERLGIFYCRQARWHRARSLLQQATRVLREDGPAAYPKLITALSWLSTAAANAKDPAASVRAAEEAVDVADSSKSPSAVLMRVNLAIELQKAGHDKQALDVVATTGPMATDASASLQLSLIDTAVQANADLGRWQAAVSRVVSGRALLASGVVVQPSNKVAFLLAAAQAYKGAGQIAEASAMLAAGRQVAAQPDSGIDLTVRAIIARRSGVVASELRRFGDARKYFGQAASLFARLFGPDSLWRAGALQDEAVAAAGQDDDAAADRLLTEELAVLHRIAASPARFAPAYRLASREALAVGDGDRAQRDIDAAGRALAQQPAASAIDRALYLTQRAQVEIGRGDMTPARGDLRHAYQLIASGDAAHQAQARVALLTIAETAIAADADTVALRAADRAMAVAHGTTRRFLTSWALMAKGRATLRLGHRAAAAASCDKAARLVRPASSWPLWRGATQCVGEADEELGRPQQAKQAYMAVLAAAPGHAFAPIDRMELFQDLGVAERDLGNYAAALGRLDPVVSFATAGGRSRLGMLSNSLSLRGSVLRRLGRYPQAEKDYAAALAACAQLGCGDLLRATILNGLGLTRLEAGEPQQAEKPLRVALALREQAGIPRLLMETRGNIADLDLALGHGQAAADALAALDKDEQQAGLGDTEAHAITLGREAGVALRMGDGVKAERLQRAAIGIAARHLPPDNPILAELSLGLAGMLDARGVYAEASALRHSALADIAHGYGADSPLTALARLSLLPALARQGDASGIGHVVNECIRATQSAFGAQSPKLSLCLTAAADQALQRFDLAAARHDADRLLDIEHAAVGSASPVLVAPLLLRAQIDIAADQQDAALTQCATAETMLGTGALPFERIQVALVREAAQAAKGDFAAARATTRAALAMLPPGDGSASVGLRMSLEERLSGLLIRAARPQEAAAIWRDLLATKLPDWAVVRAQGVLGRVLRSTGHPDAASAVLLQRAAGLQRRYGATAWPAQEARYDAALALAQAGRFADADAQVRIAGAAADWQSDLSRVAALSAIAVREGNFVVAQAYVAHLVTMLGKRFGADSPALFGDVVLLARIDLLNGHARQAHDLLQRARPMAAARPGTAGPSLAELRGALAESDGRLKAAEADFRKAITLAAGPLGSRRVEAGAHAALGQVYLKSARPKAAWRELSDARGLFAATDGPRSPASADIMLMMAKAALRRGDTSTATALRNEARGILGKDDQHVAMGRWL